MKILVAAKRVPDYHTKVRLKSSNQEVDLDQVKMTMNPFDEIALEEAIRCREKGLAREIILTTIGSASAQDILRQGLAMGADRAILIQTDLVLQPLKVASLLAQIAQQQAPDLILMGKQAIDNDCNQTGQMLAGLLGWAQGTFASALEFKEGRLWVTREIDSGLETLSLQLPAVVTTDLRLNEPRFPTLPNIMKAKQKKIDCILADSLGVDLANYQEVLHVKLPVIHKELKIVNSINDLMSILKEKGQLS